MIILFIDLYNYMDCFKGAIQVKMKFFKGYGLLILPLTLIYHFDETPENGHDSGQNLSNPVVKSY